MEILGRGVDNKGMQHLIETYQAHKKVGGVMKGRHVIEMDRLILKEHLEGVSISELSRKYDISRPMIETAIRLASIERLRLQEMKSVEVESERVLAGVQ